MSWLFVRSLCSVVVIAVLGAASFGGSSAAAQAQQVTATMADQNGSPAGSVSFTQLDGGVLVRAEVYGLTPGFHGFHVHVNASCDPATGFQSAGGHLNLGDSGMPPMGQSGDLTNLWVMSGGFSSITFVVDKFTVDDLLADGGRAVVIHADPDNFMNIPSRYGVSPDQTTMDTGDAGARVACGVVQPS
jgi:superoxide dismutase, Cu-Zn family